MPDMMSQNQRDHIISINIFVIRITNVVTMDTLVQPVKMCLFLHTLVHNYVVSKDVDILFLLTSLNNGLK